MAKASATPAWQRAIIALAGTVIGVVAIGTMYWLQEVFIPLAMAIFFAFLLNPLVHRFQRFGLNRTISALTAVALVTLLLVGLGWVVSQQVASLLQTLPGHTANITAKIKTVRELGATGKQFEQMMAEINRELQGITPKDAKTEDGEAPAAAPAPATPVVVEPAQPGWAAWLSRVVSPALAWMGGLALALILLIFLLLGWEDMRSRFLRLVGQGQLSSATRAVEDASNRISRFLIMQAIVNSTYGIALAAGLFLLGVEYALLWGFLAAVLRYVPYIGPWVAAIFPITMSVAVHEGWWQPAAVVGYFIVLELISNNVMEPWLYGKSIGVSEVALLVAAAFWTWLWGPVGLVLSAPLTVVLVVLGKYVPYLGFLEILLGDAPALEPHITYYQRLMARDQDEAANLALEYAKGDNPQNVYDELLIPSLTYTKRDRERDELNETDERFVLQTTREVLEELEERHAEIAAAANENPAPEEPDQPRIHLLACPARDEEDRLALEMLAQQLDPARWDVEVTAVETLTSELLERVAEEGQPLVCIGSLPPGGLAHTRYLCKRLRARFPDLKILVGRWGLKGNVEENREQLTAAGAYHTGTTLHETRNLIDSLYPILVPKDKESKKRETVGAS